jgi:glycosyltransferase involved in cell wall biosynthesis
MKKSFLFISNISNRITNFTLPSIIASQNLGYNFHFAANCTHFKDDPEKYGITIHHVDIARNPFNPKNIVAYFQLLKLIRKERIDVIHCNTPVGGLLGRLCGARAKVRKIIYTAHGFHFYNGSPLVNRTVFKFVELWLARYTDALITINSEDYSFAQRMNLRNNGNAYYIPGVGVDTSSIGFIEGKRDILCKELGLNNDVYFIISIGELNRNKNNHVIIHALGLINNEKIHYLLCGVGDERKHLEVLAKSYGILDRIHFLGYRNDIPQLLKSVDLFVLPSFREGLSRSLMEAMSAGLPCIVSNIRGNLDLIDNDSGGFLCDAQDTSAFALKIEKLINDTGLSERMGKYNLEKVKKYDISNVKTELKGIYQEVLI